MDRDWLQDKTVVIVGASSGVGKYLAFNLIIKHNCSIIAISNEQEQMEDFAKRIYEYKDNFSYYIFDATKEADWEDFANTLKEQNIKVDVLINSVGELPKFNKFEYYTQKDIVKTFNTNFYASVFSIRYLLPYLKKSKTPAIINLSCLASSLSVGGTSVYSASKSALKSYTEILSQELDSKFYVALVKLGVVDTQFFKNQSKEHAQLLTKNALTPSKASKKIISGMERKKTRIVVGFKTHIYDNLSRLFPTLTSKALKMYFKKKKINLYKD